VPGPDKGDALWLLPDALRIHGDVLAALEGPSSQPAEAHLRESVEVSVRQGALGWELRSVESFANFLGQQGRNEEASTLLLVGVGSRQPMTVQCVKNKYQRAGYRLERT
jgi:hypothetical protein